VFFQNEAIGAGLLGAGVMRATQDEGKAATHSLDSVRLALRVFCGPVPRGERPLLDRLFSGERCRNDEGSTGLAYFGRGYNPKILGFSVRAGILSPKLALYRRSWNFL
jgi:hypothetical protein